MEFTGRLENFNTRLWTYHVKIPEAIARHFLDMGDKRVICHIQGKIQFQCAIMSAGDGVYFILLNKKIRDQLELKEGSKMNILLEKDQSKYGLPFPDELKEVFLQDKHAGQWFEKLTPGKQRNLIYMVNQVKGVDRRIHRSITIAEHLKSNAGKIDFRSLTKALQK